MSDCFIALLIQLSLSSDRREYTPGFLRRPHLRPKEVTPTSFPSHSSGPPESPYGQNKDMTCHIWTCYIDTHTCSFSGPTRSMKQRTATTSPYMSKADWKGTCSLKTRTAVFDELMLMKAFLPHRCQPCYCRLNRHISCCWWWQASGCSIQGSCTSACRSQSRWWTSGRPTFSWWRCLFSPIRPPGSWNQPLGLWPSYPTWAISLPWFSSPVCWAEM